MQNRVQKVLDEFHRAATYDKFVRKLENTSQKPPQSLDVVKGKDDQVM